MNAARLPAWLRPLIDNEKFRFLMVGGWNTAFGWATFALIWWLLGEHSNLWVVSAISHLISTTQSFAVQRHLVFRSANAPWWTQYVRFQWAYLCLLGLGSFALNALVAQGLHPLVAQTLVFVLMAVCGFILGKNFIYAASQWRATVLLNDIKTVAEKHALAILAFVISMVLFEAFWGAPFYDTTGKVGADFDLTAVSLLEGKFWLDSNGWIGGLFNPPWFTPAWCGGATLYTDPQSVFYSPLQIFAYFSDPFTATHWSSLLFAAVAFWGSYALGRVVLRWTPAAAVLLGILGMANSFLPEHSIYGQVGYQPLYLWTVLVLALCWPGQECEPLAAGASLRRDHLWPSITVGLALTGWLQFGFSALLIPGSLAVLLLCLVLIAFGRASFQVVMLRGFFGSIVALCLNGSKLYESLSLLRNFPRDFYAMFGLATPHEAVLAVLRTLVQPTEWTARIAYRSVARMTVPAVHPDWAVQFGLGALVLAAAALAVLLVSRRRAASTPRERVANTLAWVALAAVVFACALPPPSAFLPGLMAFVAEIAASAVPVLVLIAAVGGLLLIRTQVWVAERTVVGSDWRRVALWIAIVLIVLLPVILLHDSGLREVLKRFPVLSTITWTMRWLVVYVPLAQVALALPFALALRHVPLQWHGRATFAALALVWAGPALAPMHYYEHPWIRSYSAYGATHISEDTRRTGKPIPIEAVYVNWYRWMYVGRNDSMMVGLSQGLCYNPIYGYLLEGFPQIEWMQAGPVLKEDMRGQSLLRNPACLVHPEHNTCKAGDGFTLSDPHQRLQAGELLDRKPMQWQRPLAGKVLSVLSQLSFWVLLTMLVLRLWRAILQQRPETPPPADLPDPAAPQAPVQNTKPPESAPPLEQAIRARSTATTSTDANPAPAAAVMEVAPPLLPWVLFLVSMLVFEGVWGLRYYSSPTHVGHDFALTATGLMEGRNWILSNGGLRALLDPPWFTPAWCAGTAFYADPQSVFYSPLQWLAVWFEPIRAVHLNALLFAAVAFMGGYALARRVFQWQWTGAVVFGVLGMANTFLPWRSAVGEAGYQPFYIWTFLVLALCWPASASSAGGRSFWQDKWSAHGAPSIGVALCLTCWLQFGFGAMMIPAALGAGVLCLFMVIVDKASLGAILLRSACGIAVALILNASKLYESTRLLANFPRDFYAIPGFDSFAHAVMAIFMSLVQPSEWTTMFGMRNLRDAKFAVLPHEWSLNFGLGALVLALVCLAAWRWVFKGTMMRGRMREWSAEKWIALAGIVVLLAITPLLLWSNESARSAVKAIPILSSTAWPMRWVVIWLPLAQLALAWPVQALLRVVPARMTTGLLVAALAAIWLGPITEPHDYYSSNDVQAYNPQPVLKAFSQSAQVPIPIERVVMTDPNKIGMNRNDAMFTGGSEALCYNPIYGYGLESFPQPDRLAEGPALSVDASGQSLIYNAACLVHPEANACKPGDGFRMNDPVQRAQAERFVSRQPYDWQRPAAGVWASWTSLVSWLIMLAWLVFISCLRVFRIWSARK